MKIFKLNFMYRTVIPNQGMKGDSSLTTVIRQLHEKLFDRFWNPILTLTLAGTFAAFYFGLTGTLWAVTGEFTRLGGNLLQLFGVDPANWAYFKIISLQGGPLNRTDGWIVIGMLLGSLVGALMSNNFKIKFPRLKRRWLWSFVGGVLSGFGTRLAMGCNLAAFFTGVPQFTFSSWIFIVGTVVGTYIGVKLAVLPIFKGKPKLEYGIRPIRKSARHRRVRTVQSIAGWAVLIFVVVIAIYYIKIGHGMLGLAAIFGALFGLFIQRGQICFTSGLRDVWLTGRGTLAKAIIIGMAIQSIGTAIFIYKGVTPHIFWTSPGVLVGGIIFGVGIVIAGSCETGWMYRCMEGQVQFLAVGAGNIIGATILAYGWDHWGVYNLLVKGWPKINLVQSLGWSSGIMATGAFLLFLYALVAWREGAYLKKIGQRSPTPDEISV